MWLRKSSIRPVPGYARIEETTLEQIQDSLLEDEEQTQDLLDDAFERFDEQQPALSAHLGELLARPISEPALAIAYFVCLSIWLAFSERFGRSLDAVSEEELLATLELFQLDEELRKVDSSESVETDDVVAMEQPALFRFVQRHFEAALESHGQTLEVEELDQVYRAILVHILCLSYAVRAPLGYPMQKAEIQA